MMVVYEIRYLRGRFKGSKEMGTTQGKWGDKTYWNIHTDYMKQYPSLGTAEIDKQKAEKKHQHLYWKVVKREGQKRKEQDDGE